MHVVRDVIFEHSLQPSLVRDDHVVQALTSDRTDDAFDVGVLPGRARRRSNGLDVHAGDGGGDTCEDRVPIVKEIRGRLMVWEGIAKLLRRPVRCGMLGDGHVDDPSTLVREMTSTKSILNVTVGTTKRSTAMIWLTWFVRNVRHVCDSGRGGRRMYLATVDWLTERPNF